MYEQGPTRVTVLHPPRPSGRVGGRSLEEALVIEGQAVGDIHRLPTSTVHMCGHPPAHPPSPQHKETAHVGPTRRLHPVHPGHLLRRTGQTGTSPELVASADAAARSMMSDKPGRPSNPASASEARITKVMYGDRTLRSPEDCATCAHAMKHPNEMTPYHDASPRCESGKRPHCTCSACF